MDPGPHIDNLETREERLLIRGSDSSIEPGVYIPARWVCGPRSIAMSGRRAGGDLPQRGPEGSHHRLNSARRQERSRSHPHRELDTETPRHRELQEKKGTHPPL